MNLGYICQISMLKCFLYLDVPAVGCSDDDWCTRDNDEDELDDDIGEDSTLDGKGVHGRTTISGSDSMARLKRLS